MPESQTVQGWWGWSDALVKQLIKLRKEGFSASQIGKKLGVTRCAVLGKVHRLGVSVPKMASTSSKKKEPRPRSKLGGFKFGSGFVADNSTRLPRPIIPHELPPARARGAAAALLALEPGDCRWPIGDPTFEGFRFCGAKCRFGQMYCEHHHTASRGVFRRYEKS